MTDLAHDHDPLVDYLLGELSVAERDAFETHLVGCATCAAEARDLGSVTDRLDVMVPAEPLPAALRRDITAAVAAAAVGMNGDASGSTAVAVEPTPARVPSGPPEPVAPPAHAAPPPRPAARNWSLWPRRFAFAGGLAVAAVAAVIVVSSLQDSTGSNVEVEGQLTGDSTANVVVSMLGSGREVDLNSPDFPILPKGEAYEVWFVGPGDSSSNPNRISAGTFHPDEEGNTDVLLHAAVDPALYPLIEITAEPSGGNPAVEGPVVSSLDASSQQE